VEYQSVKIITGGEIRDLEYDGGFFKKDYCHPCYYAAHEETVKCSCIVALIMIPVIIVLLLTMVHP